MLKEFRDFIARGNVMDMAVGIIVGAAFTAIVTSLVADLINPIIGLFTGGIDFTNNYAVLSGDVPEGASLEAARESGASIFAYGSFIMALINFLIIAFVVFMLVRMVNKIKAAAEGPKVETPKEAPPPPPEVALLTEIRDALKAR
ncbi:large conductance mechanosensitive channel protein MscL [Maritimibacter sp. DP1N21-5]|uniref:large conductance mechanosensitive channel protein MscL n=1 Tax=Maritimibacter sp. DP1N21-5 TaxID=2836867 RepID=UPI001C496907|nr:large conductance mechanosensitive channel protein MscL [Maritimibacter sp. DP1N21-5]MBV7408357.1 large conductance mechanosensitive channel protein MscL [Maritimibacter sp. DP1N21-5]